jgi:HAD superfamily hydrolase (TIGR01509 family)
VPSVKAVLFDYSGTLFRLNEDDGWFAGMGLDAAQRADVMDRMTHPTAEVTHHAWAHRDLDPDLHREAYLHVLEDSGLAEEHARALYERVIDPAWWTPYPDTAAVLNGLRAQGIATAVVSNIAWDIRRSFDGLDADPDEFVLSFEVGAVKPDPRIFSAALSRLGVDAADALMIGDSEENDGGALALGCAFALVDPLHTEDRPTGLIDALREHGVLLHRLKT